MGLIKFKKRLDDEAKIAMTLAAHNIDVVLDIGANRGQTAERLRRDGFKGEIISIEPLPALQEELQAKAAKDANWRVLQPLAIGESVGETVINMSVAPDMSSILGASGELLQAYPKTAVLDQITVSMTTLDALYAELKPAGNVFVKIDTQGYEMAILKGAEETLKTVKGLRVEMSLEPLYDGEATYLEIIDYLAQRGFKPHMLVDIGFSKTLSKQLQLDGVFFRDA